MAALPPIRRLLVEDFPAQKGWITPLLIIYNSFAEAVVNALNKGLTIVDHTTSDIKTVTLTTVPTPSTDGGAVGPASVPWTKPRPPKLVHVGDVQKLSGTPLVNTTFTLASAVQLQWAMAASGKAILITGVAGITPTAAVPYVLVLLCIQG